MKVAYYSPLPPERSGIADYSALLLPALEERVEVAVVRRGARRPPRGTDVALYHVGNNPAAHEWIVKALRRKPGVVVLHDLVLHHLVAGMTVGRGDAEGYRAALEREAGGVGRLLGHGVVDGILSPLWEARAHEFPLTREVTGFAAGLIVHSHYVEERARATGYEGPIWRIPHPAWPPPEALQPASLPAQGPPVIGCFGNLTPSKRIPQLAEAFARLRRRFPDALLLLVGPVAPRFDLAGALAVAGLKRGDGVVELGYVAEPELWSLISACDICVSLRSPTMGETSGAAIRTLSLGRPLVVSDVGWFSELPDSVAAKVPVDEWEVDILAAVLELLAGDDEIRAAMAAAAAEYAQREHGLERVADAYTAALEQAAGGGFLREAVLRDVARAAVETGLDPEGDELARVAAAVRELGLGD